MRLRGALKLRVSAVAICMILAGLAPARAQNAFSPVSYEFKAGVLAHDVPDLWSGFRRESGVDINLEMLVGPGLPFLGGRLRPAFGASINTAGGTSKAYIDARWEVDFSTNFFFATGLGAAVHNGKLDLVDPDRKALGSRVLFHIPIEFGYRLNAQRSMSVYFEHVSNANLARSNEGLDSIGVRLGNRF